MGRRQGELRRNPGHIAPQLVCSWGLSAAKKSISFCVNEKKEEIKLSIYIHSNKRIYLYSLREKEERVLGIRKGDFIF